tara:strand:+ start:298 stop:1494 length:1197 start_codon:yes stop_codon:yes gene_type:complete
MNILVDAKNEYTIRIINILSPLIMEGLNSIYNKAKEISNNDNILKIFQSFLKRIPKWTDEILDTEVNRIKNNCKDYELLYNLIRASIKANLRVLVYSPIQNCDIKPIDPLLYENLDFKEFIHNIYIECAREIWNNPYLLYHDYPPIEIKRNQRDTIDLIKKCIEESIRKSLPMKYVLEVYLGDEDKTAYLAPKNNEVENTLTEIEAKSLKKMVDTDLKSPLNRENKKEIFIPNEATRDNTAMSLDKTNATQTKKSSEKIIKTDKSIERMDNSINQNGGKVSSDKGLENKILNILDSNKLKLSDEPNNLTSENKLKSNLKLSATSSDDLISSNMDSNLKKILKKDLGNSETEESLSFKPENNSSKYQEIFSNSSKESLNSQQREEEIDKNKFFNNYLNF